MKAMLFILPFIKPYRISIFIGFIAIVITSLMTLAVGQIIKVVVDNAVIDGSITPETLNTYLGIGTGLAGVYAIGLFFRTYLMQRVGVTSAKDIRQAVFNNLMYLSPTFYEDNPSGEIQTRIISDSNVIAGTVATQIPAVASSLMNLVGAMLLAFHTNTEFSMMVMIAMPIVFLPIIIFGKTLRKLAETTQQHMATAGSAVGEIMRGLKVVQSCNKEKDSSDYFDSLISKVKSASLRNCQRNAMVNVITMFLALSGVVLLLWKGALDIAQGSMTIGELGAFAFYANLILTSGAGFATTIAAMQTTAGASARLGEMLKSTSEITEPQTPIALDTANQARIEFKNLSFSYATRPGEKALNDINLSVAAGESIAFVGASGAGKSTLFDLIQRFYLPNDGSIEINGHDISQYRVADLRSLIGLVPQTPVLFSGSIMMNIRFGRPDATDEQVYAAAKAAYADEFIEKLENGYQTELGESGARLSGGQRQRISLARTILNDPQILLLDEATSALDSQSEALVQKALEQFIKGRVTFIIAHRLYTVKNVDRIVVLEKGKIVETGTHQQLMVTSSLYSRWAKQQFEYQNNEGIE